MHPLGEARDHRYGAVAEGYWEDVGTLEAYLRAHKDVLDGRVQLEREVAERVSLMDTSTLEEDE